MAHDFKTARDQIRWGGVNVHLEQYTDELLAALELAINSAPKVEVRFDELICQGETHIEWLTDKNVSIAMNDRRFVLSSNGKIELISDYSPQPAPSGAPTEPRKGE